KADLALHEADYRPKFNAAIKFSCENGFQFTIITEDNIRTTLLQNASFLNRYTHEKIDEEYAICLLTGLSSLNESTPEALITRCENITRHRGELLYVLWQLVANKEVGCNLNTPITMHSKIWINP